MLLLLDEHSRTDEIAKRLFISEHTVRSHVKSCCGSSASRRAGEALERSRSPGADSRQLPRRGGDDSRPWAMSDDA